MNKSINKILSNNDLNRVVIVLHGIALMTFIKNYCNIFYDEKTFKIVNNNQILYNDMIKVPDVFKLVIDNDYLISLENILLRN